MKLFIKTIIFNIIIFTAVSMYAQSVTKIFDLKGSIKSGLKNNQKLLVVQEQVHLSQQRVSEARSLIFPKVDFSFDASQSQSDLPTVLTPSFGSVYLPAGDNNQYYNTRFSLLQYIYAGGRYTTNLKLAEANYSQAKSKAEAIKNEVIRDIKKVYYELLLIKKKINLCESMLNEIFQNKSKYMSFRIQLKSELMKIEYEYEKKKLSFLDKLGIELDTEIEVKGDIYIPGKEYEINKLLVWAFQNRPELQQTQFLETIDALRVNLSLIERFPTINFGANYEWAGSQFPLKEKNWNATISLNLPVFDGWASWARIKQQKHKARESKIRRVEIKDSISLEVHEYFLDYKFWKEKEKILNADKENAKSLFEKYESEILWLESIRNLIFSHIDLTWATGRDIDQQ